MIIVIRRKYFRYIIVFYFEFDLESLMYLSWFGFEKLSLVRLISDYSKFESICN